ncbi:MAG: hypothetical protein A2655_01755 [Candidatus Yanofskybacteria bacterium RIFCSPHIGHO2_01_FULL_43_42]|uniref:Uncharacterized protein n=1 Tax=Candidatus Yanofskybacteria bacterium RIFCSPLOWO2_01_FULL_43_22 TaxID=1802695 RepID=A0A1F8GGU8_9BACT|nr:MAG: hypothetical protein A2655_01755 [Candidatus Yanofskybacteria bacterium RIFCSPHIGHO2_01_FULL_43_42]OGN13202.1 MAG: hypothetical protein A3D48_02660 [Candidatus Yanofskybacteria bacterium RIFCSPHIGHO2_02_FULL_43_17]OGN24617.1 MAG: hypothetical protein A3A13_00885 [Candidatus Yanofskybacteria bacterium RIFCSPLOWO2_01_FULL_43_22]
MKNIVKVRLSVILFAVLIVPFFMFSIASADVLGQNVRFNTNSTFDKLGRTSATATLRHIGENAYFYVDDSYWDDLDAIKRQNLLSEITQLAQEFDITIYPLETSFWGHEAKPGIDGDNRITILLEQLKSGNGGYFSTSNGYPKTSTSESNEREMVVVNAESVAGIYAKTFLAHEFEHLISFNQKELADNASEEVWLNELRAEYTTTLVGYNNSFAGSNLERRANTFFNNPSDSLTEWPNVSLDYSLVALFAEYIAEEYGQDLLKESLQLGLAGISSIDAALAARGNPDRFPNLFSNWLIASYVNNESLESKFGYARAELKNLKAVPQRITVLSFSDSSVFDYLLKPWQPYGHKIYANGLANDKVIKLFPEPGLKFVYADNLGRSAILEGDFYVTNPGGLDYFFIFPVNSYKTEGFGLVESESGGRLTVSFMDKPLGVDFGSIIKDGALIKKATENETYVIEGKYKRYLRPEIIALYGHLNAVKAIEVDETTFHSYTTANYVRYVNDERVYAVWPDGTKHWLNITPQQWEASGRDWGAIFIINDLELNTYKIGADITR